LGEKIQFENGSVVDITLQKSAKQVFNMKQRYCCDAQKSLFTDYYINQAGGSLPVFQGSRGQRGHGFGSVLSGLFRSAVPMLKRIEKRHLQQAHILQVTCSAVKS
jgi:hypothetical protein